MSYAGDLLTQANALDSTSSASDLYLVAKAYNDLGIREIPRAFIANIYDRVIGGQSDPYELAFLYKILKLLEGWSVQNLYYGYTGGARDYTKIIGSKYNGVYIPSFSDLPADIIMPTGYITVTETTNVRTANSSLFPSFYTDNTLVRIRLWGAGGGGAAGSGNVSYGGGGGGGGGGYVEGLISFGQLNASLTIGLGGAGGQAALGGGDSGGNTSIAGFQALGGRGSPTYVGGAQSLGGLGGGFVIASVGAGNLYSGTGYVGGNGGDGRLAAANNAGGGGSAAGPWGNGFTGGIGVSATVGPGGAGIGGSPASTTTGAPGTTLVNNTVWMSPYLAAALLGSTSSGSIGMGGSGVAALATVTPGIFGGGGGGTGAAPGGRCGGGGGGTSNGPAAQTGGNGYAVVEFFL